MPLTIRFAAAGDAHAMALLFHETVKTVNSRDYLAPQVAAWAGEYPDPEKWRGRLTTRTTFVADRDRFVVGFAEFESTGHIGALYVHARHQRTGVATALLSRIEEEAKLLCIGVLFTEASITAQPFFRKCGFETVQAQDVQYRGCTFRNYQMRKIMTANNRIQ